MGWNERVTDLWDRADSTQAADLVARMDALAAERPDDDPVALYERASARDFADEERDVERLYRAALEHGLEAVDRRRGVEARAQLASTLRLLQRPEEALEILAAVDRRDLDGEQADWLLAFEALALRDAGRTDEALTRALEGLARHLTQYGAVVRRYADEAG